MFVLVSLFLQDLCVLWLMMYEVSCCVNGRLFCVSVWVIGSVCLCRLCRLMQKYSSEVCVSVVSYFGNMVMSQVYVSIGGNIVRYQVSMLCRCSVGV